MGAIEHGGVWLFLAALAGCVVAGKWVYGKYEERDVSAGGRVAAGVVLVLVLGVIVIVALAVIAAQSSSS